MPTRSSGSKVSHEITRDDLAPVSAATDGTPHTLRHAIYPSECGHAPASLKVCVICSGILPRARKHTDTCGERCFRRVLAAQRNRDRLDTPTAAPAPQET